MDSQDWWDIEERKSIATEAEGTFGVPICGVSLMYPMWTCLSCPEFEACWPEDMLH